MKYLLFDNEGIYCTAYNSIQEMKDDYTDGSEICVDGEFYFEVDDLFFINVDDIFSTLLDTLYKMGLKEKKLKDIF